MCHVSRVTSHFYLFFLHFFIKNKLKKANYPLEKHRKNCEKLHQEHLSGCQGVKLFLLKDVTITTVTTATVNTVTILLLVLQFEFLSFVTI